MIQCVVDDVAFVAADAVIRPADTSLEAASASARSLDRQGGGALAAARALHGNLEAGAAVVTAAGDLAVPLVIHTVLTDRDLPVARDIIRRALEATWRRCLEWGIARVATAPLGAGPGQLELEEAMQLMASTLSAIAPDLALTVVFEREGDREIAEAALRARSW